MTFASLEFLIFFAIVMLAMILVQHVLRLKNQRMVCHVILLIASYIFYGWWDWRFLALLFGVTLVSFLTASKEKWKLAVGVIAPLAALGIFKYFNFFVASFCTVFGLTQSGGISIILPVGISFYTFQALSYTIDVYRGNLERENNFIRFALYISFFPQLVAGPIVKASEFLPQLKEERKLCLPRLEEGIQIFVFGMFKKLVIADNLSIFVDEVFRTPGIFHWSSVSLAVISYAIQIYMDFSGYSDMAIGCAKILGYDLRRNFNLPYISRNVSEFWKRWHISLSSWLQQYLYIPLGGNRKGKGRTYLNLMITMLLGGLWHGANWTFVLWGGMHGIALCVHKLFSGARKKRGKSGHHNPLAVAVCILFTDLFVFFCWIFFRAKSISEAWAVIRQIVTLQDGIVHTYTWSVVAILLVTVCTIVAAVRWKKLHRAESAPLDKNGTDEKKTAGPVGGFYPIMNLSKFRSLLLLFVEIGLIAGLAYIGGNPFIYFQF